MFSYKNLIIVAVIVAVILIVGFAISWLTVAISVGCFIASPFVVYLIARNNPKIKVWIASKFV